MNNGRKQERQKEAVERQAKRDKLSNKEAINLYDKLTDLHYDEE